MVEQAADDPEMMFGWVNGDWVNGDEAYGDNIALRAKLEGRGLNYVMAVSCDWSEEQGPRKRNKTETAPPGPGLSATCRSAAA